MTHTVEIAVTINSHSEPDEMIRKAAMQNGVPAPLGPITAQKVVRFQSSGSSMPDAADAALEALVAFCKSEGAAVVPGKVNIALFERRQKEQ